MKNKPQSQIVLEHLKNIGPISNADAVENYQIYRLSRQIEILRKRGHSIRTVDVPKVNRPGTYGQYVLEP